jgi:hypothetical protein
LPFAHPHLALFPLTKQQQPTKQVGVQAGIAFTLALTLQATVRLAVPGALATPAALFGVYVAATATHTLVNMLPIHWIGLMNRVSIFWCARA